MITLHHLEYSQSFRILWLLEELGVEYDLKIHQRDPKTHLAPKALKALSPLGTAPVICDGKLVLSESNAIIDYILDKYADNKLKVSPGNPNRARHLFWFHASQGSMTPLLLISTIFSILTQRSPFFIKPIIRPILALAQANFTTPRMNKLLEQAETDLGSAPWFGGDQLSAADIALSYTLHGAQARGDINEAHPNCLAWLERVNNRPSFKAARKKDGKASILFKV